MNPIEWLARIDKVDGVALLGARGRSDGPLSSRACACYFGWASQPSQWPFLIRRPAFAHLLPDTVK